MNCNASYNATTITANESTKNNQEELPHYEIAIAANCLVTLLILVNNSLLLFTLIKTKKLRTLPNAYIASLAVADLLVGIVMTLRNFWLLPSTEWVFNDNKYACLPVTCLLYISGAESIFSLVLVTFDRYMFIIHPFWYKRNVSSRVVGILIFVSWVFSIVFGCVPMWSNHFTVDQGCNPLSILSHSYFICQEVYFFTNAIAIAFMYGRIYRVMSYQRGRSASGARIAHAQGKSKKDMSRWPVIRFLIFVCAMFFVCWAPVVVMLPLYFTMAIPGMVVSTTVTVAALNSGCNLFAFITMNKDFRRALAALILRRKQRQIHTEDNRYMNNQRQPAVAGSMPNLTEDEHRSPPQECIYSISFSSPGKETDEPSIRM